MNNQWQNNFGAFSFKKELGANASVPASMPGIPISMSKQETKPSMSVSQNIPASNNVSIPKQSSPIQPGTGPLKPQSFQSNDPNNLFKKPESINKFTQPAGQKQGQIQSIQSNDFNNFTGKGSLNTGNLNMPSTQIDIKSLQKPVKIEPKYKIYSSNNPFWKDIYYTLTDNATKINISYNPETWELKTHSGWNNDTRNKNILDWLDSLKIQKENEYINAKKRSPVEADMIQKELNAIMKEHDRIKHDIESEEWRRKRKEDDKRVEELNKKMKDLGLDFDPENNPEHKAMHEEFYEKVGNYNGKDPILYKMRREDMIEGPKDDYTKEINKNTATANLDNGISNNPVGTENSEASKQEPIKKYNDEEIGNMKWAYADGKIDNKTYEDALVNYEGTDPKTLRLKEIILKKRWQNKTTSEWSQDQKTQVDLTHTKDSEWLHNINIIQKATDFNKEDIEGKKKILEEIKKWMEEQGISEARKQHILKLFENNIKKGEHIQTHQLAQLPDKTRKQIAQEKVSKLNQKQELNDGVYEQNKQKLDWFRSQGYNVDQSVVDSLSARGLNNSYDIRKKMYEKMTGHSDFRGTAEQNIYLKNMAEHLTEEDIQAILFDEDDIAVMN